MTQLCTPVCRFRKLTGDPDDHVDRVEEVETGKQEVNVWSLVSLDDARGINLKRAAHKRRRPLHVLLTA